MKKTIFEHSCFTHGCTISILYDDTPFCFKHSADSLSLVGFSAEKEMAALELKIETLLLRFCEHYGCGNVIGFGPEPFCFTHSDINFSK